MTRLEVVIDPERLETLQHELAEEGHTGLVVTNALSEQPNGGMVGSFRGAAYSIHFRERCKVELVVPDPLVENVIRTIRNACFPGDDGEGKIFLSTVTEAVRIRTGERGNLAL